MLGYVIFASTLVALLVGLVTVGTTKSYALGAVSSGLSLLGLVTIGLLTHA